MTRDSYEMHTNRMTRGTSFFGADPQTQLRTALRTNDFNAFKKLVSYGAVDLEYVYQYPDYKTCLELAITEADKNDSKINFVKLLLQHEVEVNKVNETHGAAPIHFAVENGNIEALKALLEDDRTDVNIKSKGNTAILLAIKKIQDLDDDREQDLIIYEDMIEMLLKAGANVNAPDLKGVTPVFSAAKQGLERVITLIFDYAQDRVDLDSYKHISGKTARYYLKEAFPHLLAKFDSVVETAEVIDADKLFSYLSKHEENNFVRDFTKLVRKNEHRSILTANNGMNTMLQLAAEKGLEKVVEILLKSGADPDATCSGNSTRPVALACKNGYSNILKMFIENGSTLFEPVNNETLLQIAIRGTKFTTKDSKVDFKECIKTLLTHEKVKDQIDVNYSDFKDNTALHYAARNGDQNTVLSLLRQGACIGLRNKFNEPPLADISAKTLETYLDECITTNNERPSDDDYEIRIKYSFLVYPNVAPDEECKKPLMYNNNNNITEYDTISSPEIEALLYMTENEELRPLLKHPVITSFLYLKWERISALFTANITFYFLFWFSLILYIILGYGIEKDQIKSLESLNVITHIVASMGLIILIFRELFQFLLLPVKYFQSFKNWMEIALIVVSACILFYAEAKESTKQQLSAVAILLSSAEFILLIGQFPTLSTYIMMLRTVSWNFFKFILWYCILIIAFALSFYALFKNVDTEEDQKAPNPNNLGQNKEEEEDFFEDPGSSLFKTIVMLTGEFDAGSIKFSTFPVTSHIIFIVFVFMIPIVLFNLLNGLAVSDTQEIRSNAELFGHISRVKLIAYFESIFIGKIYTKPSKLWSWIPPYLQDVNCIKPNFPCIKPLAKRINLFPNFLPLYRIVVKPNQDNMIVMPRPDVLPKIGDDYEDIESGKCCFGYCQTYKLDPTIVKNAKIVINKKSEVSELQLINKKLNDYEKNISSIEKKLSQILKKLE